MKKRIDAGGTFRCGPRMLGVAVLALLAGPALAQWQALDGGGGGVPATSAAPSRPHPPKPAPSGSGWGSGIQGWGSGIQGWGAPATPPGGTAATGSGTSGSGGCANCGGSVPSGGSTPSVATAAGGGWGRNVDQHSLSGAGGAGSAHRVDETDHYRQPSDGPCQHAEHLAGPTCGSAAPTSIWSVRSAAPGNHKVDGWRVRGPAPTIIAAATIPTRGSSNSS